MRLRRPSHAIVIAYLALFVALSGTAIAAKKVGSDGLKKAAVTTKKIADGAVNTSKLANDAVTGGKLDNGSVGEGKIASDAVTANKLAQSSVGTNKIRDEAVESGKIANGAVVEAKIGNDAVVGSKVLNGSLDLGKVAQLVTTISYDHPATIGASSCGFSNNIPVPGLQSGDEVLVIAGDAGGAGWDPNFLLGGYGPTGVGTIRVVLCNYTAGLLDPGPLSLQVLGFR